MDLKRQIEELSKFVSNERFERMKISAGNRTRKLTLLLEDVYQPHNAAAVLRTCDAFGIQDVYTVENRHRLSISRRVDMGASKWLDIIRFISPGARKYVENSRRDKSPDPNAASNTKRALDSLKKKGYFLAASTLESGSVSIDEVPVDRPIAVLVGTELTGLSKTALEMSDVKFSIPMMGFSQSMNLSVFCAVCLEIMSRKIRSGSDWRLEEGERDSLLLKWLKLSVKNSEA